MTEFIIFDLEATCWEENHHLLEQEIIEIGAYHVDAYGQVSSAFSTFVKPVIHPYLSPFCQKLTTIRQSDVDEAPVFDRAYQSFERWIDENTTADWILASWGHMDLELLENDCQRHDLLFNWEDQYIDLKKIYNRYMGNHKPFGLRKSLRKEKIEFQGIQHRALDDAYNLTQLFTKYIDIWLQ